MTEDEGDAGFYHFVDDIYRGQAMTGLDDYPSLYLRYWLMISQREKWEPRPAPPEEILAALTGFAAAWEHHTVRNQEADCALRETSNCLAQFGQAAVWEVLQTEEALPAVLKGIRQAAPLSAGKAQPAPPSLLALAERCFSELCHFYLPG